MLGNLIEVAWPYIVGALGVIGALAGAYFKGRSREKNMRDAKDAVDYKDTRGRMDGVEIPSNDDDLDEWLRKRSERSGNLPRDPKGKG